VGKDHLVPCPATDVLSERVHRALIRCTDLEPLNSTQDTVKILDPLAKNSQLFLCHRKRAEEDQAYSLCPKQKENHSMEWKAVVRGLLGKITDVLQGTGKGENIAGALMRVMQRCLELCTWAVVDSGH